MPEQIYKSGKELVDALAAGISEPTGSLIGMIKKSDDGKSVAVAPGSCDESWIEIPIEFIEKAEILDHAICNDHSHPVARIWVKVDEKNPLARAIQGFLSATASAQRGVQRDPQRLVATAAKRAPALARPRGRLVGGLGSGRVFDPGGGLGFSCNPLFCGCEGDADCNDMFESGICGPRAICIDGFCYCVR